MSDVTIYHNPNCSTSRNTLALLREKGVEPKVVEYVKVGWTAPQLTALFKQMGKSPREVLRTRNTEAEALGLTKPGAADEAIIAAMVEDPILVERPIVVTPKGAALCRPVETVLGLL
ncbi:MAG: arsenate reductase (glutaredoxin) [Proteobacteria bacterium]|nr:arsenate reductase (glutaredoxin) [Pseudomonadota bacterium]